MNNNNETTSIVALGGLGEVGKNMYVVTHNNEILIIDAGVMFPEDDLLGIDYVIQDVTYLKQNEDKIKGLIITHGHEDHIGGISFLLNSVHIPKIYTSKIAADLITKKLTERNINYANLEIVTEETIIKTKYFTVEFVGTTHSIPGSFAIAIHTPNGTIFETGDFKFDLTPIGPMANIHKMAKLGNEGVTLLMSDSTNAMSEGFSKSESKVDEALDELFSRHNSRIIIATFASNIYRLKHIVDTCKRHGRKICVFGRSMNNNIEISIEGGYIKHKDIFITPEEANKYPSDKICLLCTGSQGEPLAALSRIANGTFRQIKLRDDDVVIFSSSAIPGNAVSISRTVNRLYLKGVTVYTNTSLSDIHTSGHGNQDELKLMLRLIKPTYFMPFHGEYRMLKTHADLAIECGMPKNNTFVLGNGDVLIMKDGNVKVGGKIPAGDVYVDGNRIGDISNAVMKDRKIMANDGIIVVIANIDTKNNKLLGNPSIITRGFDNIELLKKLEKLSKDAINKVTKTGVNYSEIKAEIINSVSNYVNTHTGRKPIILPVIMDIKKDVKIG